MKAIAPVVMLHAHHTIPLQYYHFNFRFQLLINSCKRKNKSVIFHINSPTQTIMDLIWNFLLAKIMRKKKQTKSIDKFAFSIDCISLIGILVWYKNIKKKSFVKIKCIRTGLVKQIFEYKQFLNKLIVHLVGILFIWFFFCSFDLKLSAETNHICLLWFWFSYKFITSFFSNQKTKWRKENVIFWKLAKV